MLLFILQELYPLHKTNLVLAIFVGAGLSAVAAGAGLNSAVGVYIWCDFMSIARVLAPGAVVIFSSTLKLCFLSTP